MLVLARKAGERLLIGSDVSVTVLEIRRGKVRIGIDAPEGTTILRDEVRMKDEPPGEQQETK